MQTKPGPPVATQQTDLVRLAYDRIAPDYENAVAGDDWMRQILWSHYRSLFRPGDRVLDLACGTGLDSLHLAVSGIDVTAIDISPGMLEQLRVRAHALDVTASIDSRVLSFAELDEFPAESFDGIISGFAGLNTVPDIDRFARDASRILRPCGHMVLHLLNQFSLWEWLGAVRSRDWNSARSVRTRVERDFTIGGVSVRHQLYVPQLLYRDVFADRFRLERAYGLGCLRPPHTVAALPPLVVAQLEALDKRFGDRWPLLNHGRFFVLDLVKRSNDDDCA